MAKYLYTWSMKGSIVEVDDHWVATTEKWGLTTYGKTAQEADLRMDYAINLLASRVKEHGSLEDEFIRAGIDFKCIELKSLGKEASPLLPEEPRYTTNHLQPSEWTFERDLFSTGS